MLLLKENIFEIYIVMNVSQKNYKETERFLIVWFTLQEPVTTNSRLDQSQEPTALSGPLRPSSLAFHR